MDNNLFEQRGIGNGDKLLYCVVCAVERGFSKRYDGLEFLGRQYSILFCRSCGLGITSPFPDTDTMRALYSSEAYRDVSGRKFIAPVEKIVGFMVSLRCARVERYVPCGRVLDVGCGRGDFLYSMKMRGWDVRGIEFDERRGRYAREFLGIDVSSEPLRNSGYEAGSFDVITVFHVLEHMDAPREFLNDSRNALRPGGLLIIAVPNSESWQARFSGSRWLHLDVPYHLHHFSLGNLQTMLADSGFKVKKVKHFTFDQNVFGFLQSMQNAAGFRRNMLFDMLRSKSYRKKMFAFDSRALLEVVLMAVTLPLFVVAALVLSFFEAAFSSGGTIEVYASKGD